MITGLSALHLSSWSRANALLTFGLTQKHLLKTVCWGRHTPAALGKLILHFMGLMTLPERGRIFQAAASNVVWKKFTFKYLNGVYERAGEGLYTRTRSNRARGNGL